jgi:hypothetical protein
MEYSDQIGVAQIAYYPLSVTPLLAQDAKDLWGHFKSINKTVRAHVWQDHEAIEQALVGTDLVCGEQDEFDKVLPVPDLPFWGGFDCLDSDSFGLEKCDLGFGCKPSSRWLGIDTLPDSTVFLSQDSIHELSLSCTLNIFKKHFFLADKSGSFYGCIDVSRLSDQFTGMAFQSIVLPKLPIHRWSEQAKWVLSGPNPKRVRNLYWGNYFGTAFLNRLDTVCDGNFLNAYAKYARYADGTENGLTWSFKNGGFVSLSLDPLDCGPGVPLDICVQKNIVWLMSRLLESELL